MGHRYSQKQDTYILNHYSIMSDRQIGRIIGRTDIAIKRRRERLGCFKDKGSDSLNRFNLKNSKRLEAIALLNYIQFGAYKDVAVHRLSELNVDTQSLIMKSSRAKVPLRIKAKAYLMFTMGMSNPEIAKELGVSRQAIWRWIDLFNPYSGPNAITLTIRSKIWK